MSDPREILYVIFTSVSTGSVILGIGYKLFINMLDAKLLEQEFRLLAKINGTYIRKIECALHQDRANTEHEFIKNTLNELKHGLELVQHRFDEKEHKFNRR